MPPEPIKLLDQQIVFTVPSDGAGGTVEVALNLLEAQLTLEDLHDNGKRQETGKFLDYIHDVRVWMGKGHSVDLTITQTWEMERRIRQAFEDFKKKVDESPESLASTDSTPSG